jgi:hypothetical protein
MSLDSLELFAVNKDDFNEFSAKSLWEVLWYYNDNFAPDDNDKANAEYYWLCFHDGPEFCEGPNSKYYEYMHYCAVPSEGISMRGHLKPPSHGHDEGRPLTNRDVLPDPYLSVRLRDHLYKRSTYEYLDLLFCLRYCKGSIVIDTEPTENAGTVGTFGVEGLLQCAAKVKRIDEKTYTTLRRLLHRITHERNAILGWPKSKLTTKDIKFAILPAYEAAECLIAYWSASEISLVLSCLQEVLAYEPVWHNAYFNRDYRLIELPFIRKLNRMAQIDLSHRIILSFLH